MGLEIAPAQVAETRMVYPIFPANANHHDTLFGGQVMAWMDQAAFICATRWCRRKVVTAHSSAIDFHHAVPIGTIVELIARLISVGRTSMSVHVELWVEPMDRNERVLACQGNFVLVALDSDNRPTGVPPLIDRDQE
jgi:acyl-CoA hydrolase